MVHSKPCTKGAYLFAHQCHNLMPASYSGIRHSTEDRTFDCMCRLVINSSLLTQLATVHAELAPLMISDCSSLYLSVCGH